MESWFCGGEVVGSGCGRVTAGAKEGGVTAGLGSLLPASPRRPGLEHFSCVPKAGLSSSETWAVLMVPALMLTDPTTQNKSLHI